MKADDGPFQQIVTEETRECFILRTCNLRRARSLKNEQSYPGYTTEDNVTESDRFSCQKLWETDDERNSRK